MLIYTSGMEYDDRLRKECLSLEQAGADVEVIVLEYANRAGRGVAEFGTPYRSVTLWTRSLTPRARLLPVKLAEMYLKFAWHVLLRRRPILWLRSPHR